MTRQEQQQNHSGLIIPAFAVFTGTADFSGAKFFGPSRRDHEWDIEW